MNELINAIIKLVSGIKVISDWGSNANRSPAPEIAGIANKKENLAAFLPDIPKANAVQIVIPDLEIPGKIATACVIPIKNAFLASICNELFFTFLEKNNIRPVTISAIDTNWTDSNNSEI